MIIDVSAFLGLWPFRALRHSGIEGLGHLIGRCGISHALVSPFESIFYRDNRIANGFLRELAGSKSMSPIAAVNPLLPDVGDLLMEITDRSIRGIKLHPDYHNYGLSCGSAAVALDFAEEQGIPIIIPVRIHDERLHHRFAMVPPTPPKALIEVAKLYPRVDILVCNARSDELTEVLDNGRNLGNLYAVVSWVQTEGFVASVVSEYGCDKLMWGSNMPLQYPEPTLEQIKKADVGSHEKEKILAGNAVDIFNLDICELDDRSIR